MVKRSYDGAKDYVGARGTVVRVLADGSCDVFRRGSWLGWVNADGAVKSCAGFECEAIVFSAAQSVRHGERVLATNVDW